MRLSENYLIKQIEDDYILIPVGQNVIDKSGILNMNKSSGFLYKCLESGLGYQELLKKFYEEYNADEAEKALLKYDLDEFLFNARRLGIIEDEVT